MAYSLGYGSPNSLQLLRSSDPCSFAAFPGGFSQARQPRRAVRRALVPSLRVRASVEGNSNSWSERDIDGWNSSNGNHKSNRNKLTGYLAAGATGLLLTIGFVFSSRTRGVKSPMMAPLVTEKTIDVSSGSRSLETIMQESGSNSTITPVVFDGSQDEKLYGETGTNSGGSAGNSSAAPSNVLIPAAIDHFQSQAFAALQALKVIDADADPSALCTRREYARWLINSTAILARNPESKVFPAMFIENFSELAFDDVTPEDPDFAYIQGLAEAGLISSRLSNSSASVHGNFSPDCPLLRQDLVSWKAAIEKRELPEVDMKTFWEKSGFLDVDKIHKDAWPALLADISSDQSIVGLAFGYTRLFQPDKPVTKAQAAAALATGDASEFVSEELARIEAETLADTAVAAHAALEAQVQEDLNLAFKRELESEREKIKIAEASAEEAKTELQRIQKEMKNEMSTIMKEQAVLDSEREFLSRLRQELEEQLQSFTRSKLEISLEKDEIQRLHKEAASEKQALVQIRSEVEVEKKALALARTWVEEEAKKASEHARMLQEARDRWEKQGIKVYVDKDLEEVADSLASLMLRIEDQKKLKKPETAISATGFRDNVRLFLYDAKDKLGKVLEKLINITGSFWASLKERAVNLSRRSEELRQKALTNFSKAAQNAEHFTSSTVTSVTTSFREGTRKVADECKGQVQKISQKFKSAN